MNLNRSILPVALVALFVGCSQQGEGERCVSANGNNDCDTGLVCTSSEDLELERTSTFPANRCCPAGANAWTDARCEPKSKNDNTTTPTGTAGAAGATGSSTAHAGSGGMSLAGAGGAGAGTAGVITETAGAAGTGT